MRTRQCREDNRNGKWYTGEGGKYIRRQNPINLRASHYKARQGNSLWTLPQLFFNTILILWGEGGESGFQRDCIHITFYIMTKISLANKKRREKIYDDFSRNEYHELCDLFDVEEYPNKFYKIRTKQYGEIDFYPMSDKLNFVRRGWKPDWLKWIKTHLLKHV